jgi:hypothetical protein
MRVQSLLKIYLITLALNGCAAFGMGKRCNTDPVPVRPLELICVSDGRGLGGCFDPRIPANLVLPTDKVPSTVNMVCVPAQDNQAKEEWIRNLLGRSQACHTSLSSE